ncbi:MAG: Signal transduction histidine kinase [Verrucomicrobia bacterium]|nr:MAG: Signal transduction histidine kinase [Verrucomicrobiota bacterium]
MRRPIDLALKFFLSLLAGVIFSGALSASAATIEETYVVQAPHDFVLHGSAGLPELATFALQRVRTMDEAKAPLGEPIWYKLVLEGAGTDGGEALWLRIRAAGLSQIQTYLLVDGRLIATAEAGFARVRPSDSPVDLQLPLAQLTGGRGVAYIRSVTTNPYGLFPVILSEPKLKLQDFQRVAVLYFYLGAGIITAALQIPIWLQTRDRSTLVYVLFAMGGLSVAFLRAGFLNHLTLGLPGGFHLGHALPLAMSFNALLALWWCIKRYDLEVSIPLAYRTLKWLGLLILVAIPASLFTTPEGFFRQLAAAQLVVVLSAAVVGLIALRLQLYAARIWFVGTIPLILAAGVNSFINLGLMPRLPMISSLIVTGFLWELLISAFALSYRFKRAEAHRHQAELQEQELEVQGRFLRVLCHDILNPLNVIVGHVQLCQRARSSQRDHDHDKSILRIASAASAIEEIISNVRNTERLRVAGDKKLPVVPTDLVKTVDSTVALFQEQLQNKNLSLVRQIDTAEVMVLAEPGMLRSTVIGNALSNAIKFSREGAKLEIAVASEPSWALLRIRDYGVGIPAELQRQFEQSKTMSSRPGTRKEPGTGFGLLLMHDTVLAMGGTLQLSSVCETDAPAGQCGTTIEIRLPQPSLQAGPILAPENTLFSPAMP